MHKYIFFLSLTILLSADSLFTSSSFQGTTGIINTPNAEVLRDKSLELSFSNQVDFERVRDNRNEYKAEQYFINLGLLPNFEFTARLANIEKKNYDLNRAYGNYLHRDLSFSVKYQFPFFDEYYPKIAIGMQDPAGTSEYSSKYIVASKELYFIRGSFGYSIDSNLLDGFFGGAEVKLTDFSYLLFDNDGNDRHIGLRINSLDLLSNYFELSLLTKTNLDDDNENISFSLNIKSELGDDYHILPNTYNFSSSKNNKLVNINEDLTNLKDQLIDIGFENIDIGSNETTIYVAYENNIFDHNELDAIGIVLGVISKLNQSYNQFEIVTKKSNQKVAKLDGNLDSYKDFIKETTVETTSSFLQTITLSRDFNSDTNIVIENENSSYLKPRIELSANLHSFIATEVGVFDYLLSARPYMNINLYKGFNLDILGDIPIYNTRNYDDDRPFRVYNHGNQLESLLLHRSDINGNFINLASVGLYKDYVSGFDEMTYTKDSHTYSLEFGYLTDEIKKEKENKDIYLGSYSYYYDSYDTLFSIRSGKYYNQDNGFDINIKRFFGDTAINFFYQNTDTQFIGFGVEIPLTPRRAVNSKYGQFKGKRDFEYHFRTSVNEDNRMNIVNPMDAKVIKKEFMIKNRFLNRDRLSEDYIKKHILRLRNVYFEFLE